MTNEEFDKQLTNRIRTVLDDAEHTGADEGWLLLREKYPPENEKKPIAWFWWAIAAALLLFGVTAGLWLNKNKTVTATSIAGIKNIPAKANNDSALQRTGKSGSVEDNRISTISQTKKSIPDTADQQSSLLSKISSRVAADKISHQHIDHRYTKNRTANNNQDVQTRIVHANTGETSGSVLPNNDHRTTTPNSTQTSNNTLVAKETTKKADTSAKQTAKLVTSLIKPVKTDSVKKIAKAVSSKRVTLSVFASAFYNYATNSNTLFNVGGGAGVDIRLTGGLKLGAGVGLMQNDLYYTQPPVSPATTGPTGGFRSYQAKLLAVQIPVNLIYQFGASHNFISAGLGSQTYISQSYTQVNTYYTSSTTTTSSSTTGASSIDVTSSTKNGFGRLDLAKTLNLSFGLGYRVSSKSVLVFEPFLNAPLSGLGSQNLQYGTFGLNLKLRFERKP